MIRTEQLTINDRQFTRTWSDANKYIVRDGVEYSEAVDPADLGRIYTETDIPIETDKSEAEEIIAILTGETE